MITLNPGNTHQNEYDYYYVYLTGEENNISGSLWFAQGHTESSTGTRILIQKFSKLEQYY